MYPYHVQVDIPYNQLDYINSHDLYMGQHMLLYVHCQACHQFEIGRDSLILVCLK